MHDGKSVLGTEIDSRGDGVERSGDVSSGDVDECVLWTSPWQGTSYFPVHCYGRAKSQRLNPQFLVQYQNHEIVTNRFRNDYIDFGGSVSLLAAEKPTGGMIHTRPTVRVTNREHTVGPVSDG